VCPKATPQEPLRVASAVTTAATTSGQRWRLSRRRPPRPGAMSIRNSMGRSSRSEMPVSPGVRPSAWESNAGLYSTPTVRARQPVSRSEAPEEPRMAALDLLPKPVEPEQAPVGHDDVGPPPFDDLGVPEHEGLLVDVGEQDTVGGHAGQRLAGVRGCRLVAA